MQKAVKSKEKKKSIKSREITQPILHCMDIMMKATIQGQYAI